ncbi:hypothetical protein ACOHYD_01720 [Desulfobacterota bacterium M19]
MVSVKHNLWELLIKNGINMPSNKFIQAVIIPYDSDNEAILRQRFNSLDKTTLEPLIWLPP